MYHLFIIRCDRTGREAARPCSRSAATSSASCPSSISSRWTTDNRTRPSVSKSDPSVSNDDHPHMTRRASFFFSLFCYSINTRPKGRKKYQQEKKLILIRLHFWLLFGFLFFSFFTQLLFIFIDSICHHSLAISLLFSRPQSDVD